MAQSPTLTATRNIGPDEISGERTVVMGEKFSVLYGFYEHNGKLRVSLSDHSGVPFGADATAFSGPPDWEQDRSYRVTRINSRTSQTNKKPR